MKKTIISILLLCIMISFSAFAGDIPESMLSDDEALVFIGKVCNNVLIDSEIKLECIKKIKGDIKENDILTFENVDTDVKSLPEVNEIYFCGGFKNKTLYTFSIKSFDGEKAELIGYEEFGKRVKEYYEEGIYEREEIKRVNVGRKLTLKELTEVDENEIKSVNFIFNDGAYSVDKNKFFTLFEKTVVTDVKDTSMVVKTVKDVFDNAMYIQLENEDGQPLNIAFINDKGEIDIHYGPALSRLPVKDYVMNKKDLKKFYLLLPSSKYMKLTGELSPSATAFFTILGVLCGLVIIWLVKKIIKKILKMKEDVI